MSKADALFIFADALIAVQSEKEVALESSDLLEKEKQETESME